MAVNQDQLKKLLLPLVAIFADRCWVPRRCIFCPLRERAVLSPTGDFSRSTTVRQLVGIEATYNADSEIEVRLRLR